MRELNGGSFDFGGDMTGRVIAAGLFGSALAYIGGLILATAIQAIARLALQSRAPNADLRKGLRPNQLHNSTEPDFWRRY
jgi:hypothetical protein